MKLLRVRGLAQQQDRLDYQRGRFTYQRGGFASQRGGFAVGLIVGLLIGLALALAVALYVTKAPVPFMNKVPQRTAEQDAAEVEKNRNWDPNSPLYGKNPVKAASGVVTQAPSASNASASAEPAASTPRQIAAAARAEAALAAASAASASNATASKAKPKRDPNDILNDRPAGVEPATTVSTVPSAVASVGSQTLSSRAALDPFMYFVQAGAYSRQEDADQQRARLAIQGFSPKVTEREQAGRTVYRVRVGPYDKKDDADSAKEKLESAGVESALVRVQK